ncbi:MAG: hypothetical protein ACYC0V_01135 [Armatimonadota bacterium]
MNFPPSILRMQIKESGSRGINLWLPIFLLWPLIAVACLIAPLVLMTHPRFKQMLGTRSAFSAAYFLGILFCSLRGLLVNVKDKKDIVHIAFY